MLFYILYCTPPDCIHDIPNIPSTRVVLFYVTFHYDNHIFTFPLGKKSLGFFHVISFMSSESVIPYYCLFLVIHYDLDLHLDFCENVYCYKITCFNCLFFCSVLCLNRCIVKEYSNSSLFNHSFVLHQCSVYNHGTAVG